MKVDEILRIYKYIQENEYDNDFDNEKYKEIDDEDEKDDEENKVCCAGKEPDCKKCIRAHIFNDEMDSKKCIRAHIFNDEMDILFCRFNDYFTKIAGYTIDDEMEQAVPKNGCWTDYSSNNLKLYGNWDKKKYENADEEAFRKEMLIKYNYNKYYDAF